MTISNLLRHLWPKHLTVDGTNYSLTAGTTDVNTGELDMANCEEASFLVALGAMAASSTVDIKVQGTNVSGSGYVDLLGTAFTQAGPTHSDKLMGITIRQSQYRYLRLAITRGDGGNSTINSVLAFLEPRVKPVTQDTGAGQFVAAPEFWLSPPAGTA